MMSKTHVTAGIAAALLLSEPGNPSVCLLAVAGGALGGVAPDMDLLDNQYKADARLGHLLAAAILGLLLVIDWQGGFGVCQKILEQSDSLVLGLALYAGLSVLGVFTAHRGFTHSLLALYLFSTAAAMIYAPIRAYYLAGYLSHLLLDLLNKKGMQLFFPLRARPCLKLCYADGVGNQVCFYLGLAAGAGLLIAKLAWQV